MQKKAPNSNKIIHVGALLLLSQERREDLHKAIRANDMATMVSILSQPDGSKLAKAKNYYGNNYFFFPMDFGRIIDFII